MSHLNFHPKFLSKNCQKKPFLGCVFCRKRIWSFENALHPSLTSRVVVQVTKGVLIPAWTASVLNCVQNETNCPLLAQVTCPVLKDVQGISWNGDEDNGLRRRESERREIKRRKKAGLYLWYSGIVYALLDSLRAIQFRRKYCWGI